MKVYHYFTPQVHQESKDHLDQEEYKGQKEAQEVHCIRVGEEVIVQNPQKCYIQVNGFYTICNGKVF